MSGKPATERQRALIAIIVAAVVGFAGACTSESAPTEPTPSPGPHYQPVERGFCGEVRVEDIAAASDLAIPSSWAQSEGYHPTDTDWLVGCQFRAQAEDDRFATELGPLSPSGVFITTVFQEPADAESKFRGTARAENGLDDLEGLTFGPAEGWWDEGEQREYARESGPYDEAVEGTIYAVDVSYVVRHVNLHMEARLGVISYPEDVEDVTTMLHELVRALLDEAVGHLTLSE